MTSLSNAETANVVEAEIVTPHWASYDDYLASGGIDPHLKWDIAQPPITTMATPGVKDVQPGDPETVPSQFFDGPSLTSNPVTLPDLGVPAQSDIWQAVWFSETSTVTFALVVSKNLPLNLEFRDKGSGSLGLAGSGSAGDGTAGG